MPSATEPVPYFSFPEVLIILPPVYNNSGNQKFIPVIITRPAPNDAPDDTPKVYGDAS